MSPLAPLQGMCIYPLSPLLGTMGVGYTHLFDKRRQKGHIQVLYAREIVVSLHRVNDQTMKRYYKAQFDPFVEMEPGLRALEDECKRYAQESASAESACANWKWFCDGIHAVEPSLDHRLGELIGWYARNRDKHPELGTSEAYDIAFSYLYYTVLPDCRNCRCLDGTVLTDRLLHRNG